MVTVPVKLTSSQLMFESGLKPDAVTYVMNPGREGPHVGSIETAGAACAIEIGLKMEQKPTTITTIAKVEYFNIYMII